MTALPRLVGGCLAAFLLFWAPAQSAVVPVAEPACAGKRLVSIGDLHGAYDPFVEMLRKAELIDAELNWISKDACLIQLGDNVDRGNRSRMILDLLMRLQEQAPEQVYTLLGNHEVMNVVGDLRYVARGEFLAFADEETDEERELAFEAFQRTARALSLPEDRRREVFDQDYPRGWFAHRRAFNPGGRYGDWLLENDTVLKIGRTVYAHGGLSRADAKKGIPYLNETVRSEILEYVRLRDLLVEARLLSIFTPFGTDFITIEQRLALHRKDPEGISSGVMIKVAKAFLELREGLFLRSDGPIWDRKLAQADERGYASAVGRILKSVDADRIVVAHSPQLDRKITARFQRRVFLTDTGAGPMYGGRISALEIDGESVRALYPDEISILVDP